MQKRVMSKWMLCCMMLSFLLCVPMNASQISEYTDSFIAKAGLNVLPYNNFVAPQQKSIAPIFADDDSIWHQESVDVIATLGIVSGDDNDHFMPSGGLTRQAAAKMIYNLSTNSNIEGIPPVTLSPFSDVSTDSRFAGYILWCLDSGIISGYSDGTFRPTNGLTQDAFLKMLLCSLGYNQVTEGYVGENWRLHVEEQSINAGLLNHVRWNSGVDKVLRNDAALMVFNTLQADLVKYSSTGAHKATNGADSGNIAHDSVMQFAELHFNGLVRTVMYRNADLITRWTYRGEFIGDYDVFGNRVSTSDEGEYTLTFNANGGSVTPSSMSMKAGRVYDVFPTPILNGFTFGGWYTGGTEEVRVTSTRAEGNITLYAHWIANTYQVTLSPRGVANDGEIVLGIVSPTQVTVQFHGQYGALPIPGPDTEHDDYIFTGWYTSATGGTMISSTTTVFSASNHVLYAHWQKSGSDATNAAGAPKMADFTYSFGNDGATFNNKYNKPIELDRYQFMYGDTALAGQFYSRIKNNIEKYGWPGNCYGMVSTSGLFYRNAPDISVAHFNTQATLPSELRLTDSANVSMPQGGTEKIDLKKFIEVMQISQYSVPWLRAKRSSIDRLDDMVPAVRAFESGNSDPVLICIYGEATKNHKIKVGHALLGYRVEGETSENTLVDVYDPNKPKDPTCHITLTRNGEGSYVGWEYQNSDGSVWGTGRNYAEIAYITSDTYLSNWNDRGQLEYNLNDATASLMTINVADATIYDKGGNLVASFRDGVHIGGNIDDDIYQIIPLDGSSEEIGGISVWLPAGNVYTVQNETENALLDVSLSNVMMGVDVTTNAETVTLFVEDATYISDVRIAEPGCHYDITIHDDRYGKGECYGDIRLTGVSGADGQTCRNYNGKITVTDKNGIADFFCNGMKIDLSALEISEGSEAILLTLRDWLAMSSN